jgi:hypothetical protein
MMLPVAAVLLIAGCTKETSEIRLDPASWEPPRYST